MNENTIPLVLKQAAPVQAFSEEEQAVLRARFPPRRSGRKMVVLLIEPGSPFKIEPGNVFPTLAALAAAMGLKNSGTLYIYLRKTNGAPAKLRGVTFQYLDVFQSSQPKSL